MYESNVNVAGSEVRSMIHEAQNMLTEAGEATGERADQLKKKGMALLASSIAKAQDLEKIALGKAKAVAATTDELVHDNPWRSIAVAGVVGAGIGLVLGMAINQK
jgi:ElaB/YqjD/DUF883 family membrane-anchored ribosome-binding protein